MAAKLGVRPGNSSVFLVVESGGNLCCSAAAWEAGGVPARPPPPFRPVGPAGVCNDGDAAGCGVAGASSSAHALPIAHIAASANAKPICRKEEKIATSPRPEIGLRSHILNVRKLKPPRDQNSGKTDAEDGKAPTGAIKTGSDDLYAKLTIIFATWDAQQG